MAAAAPAVEADSVSLKAAADVAAVAVAAPAEVALTFPNVAAVVAVAVVVAAAAAAVVVAAAAAAAAAVAFDINNAGGLPTSSHCSPPPLQLRAACMTATPVSCTAATAGTARRRFARWQR